MHWIDWCIATIPVALILGLAVYSKRYVRGVVDYLAAGRVAGRYVISVGDLSAGLSVITLVALVEAKYQTGYALGFWENIIAPVGIVISLTGYCVYRYRETRSLSIGQFLEMRYNRAFRIFAATLRTIAEMVTNAIGPAVAANFFIYFLGLPHKIMVFGLPIPCFAILVFLVLTLAMIVIWPAGRISLLVTDCFQGLLSYPIFVMIVCYILLNFSWDNEIAPVMMDRVPNESFLNPFDISALRDFNIFALVVTITAQILNRASWIGNDTTNSGRTPHEQKMAGILGAWRNGFAYLMCMIIAITVITIMTHQKFAAEAKEVRTDLVHKVAAEAVSNPDRRADLNARVEALPVSPHTIGVSAPLSQINNIDTPYFNAARAALIAPAQEKYDSLRKAEHKDPAALNQAREELGEANLSFQKFRSLYNQMMMPMALRKMLPIGLMGIFCLLMVMLLISTDDSRIFNASSTIVQDVVMPLRKEPFTPKQHLFALRIWSLAVSVFFFVCSLFFVQLDYINMFVTIMCSVWLGGAGPVMIFGLYSRFGTTTGAFSAIFVGSGLSVAGLFLQRNWADQVYPFLLQMGWDVPVAACLEAVSRPFNPYIIWQMSPEKFPINSFEIYFLSMVFGVIAYVVGSLVTYRKPFNLDRMLHRGKYAIEGEQEPASSPWNWSTVWGKLIGITPEYTRGDRIIAWSVFLYTFVYQVGICFVAVLIWNIISPWPAHWWSYYFFIVSMVIAGIIGIVSTVWFLWGGTRDTIQLFRDLSARINNPLDDGWVDGHVSRADKQLFGKDAED